MKIHVTKEDIKRGKKKVCDSCPIALALIRDLKPAEWCRVTVSGVWWQIEGLREPWGQVHDDLNPLCQEFIKEFDNGDPVEPFSFTIDEKLISKMKSLGLISSEEPKT